MMLMRFPLFAFALLAAALLLFGCAATEDGGAGTAEQASAGLGSAGTAADAAGTATAEAGKGAAGEPAGMGAAEETAAAAAGTQFSEWKAPDGSITLQVPAGWKATEKQVDTCTVNWSVENAAGTSSAYMANQILVFKSEDARQIYKAYGMSGIDSTPVSDYLGAEAASAQVVAPLSGSGSLQVTARDDALTQQFLQAVCISGLAACDASVFEATYENNGTSMRGKYLVQSFDLGDGMTWWVNVWGYTAPATEWGASKGTLEEIFTSVKYTEGWAAKCGQNAASTTGVIDEVIRSRQEASGKSAEEWDEYIRGG
ncbi:MAG: hypothetical protein V1676_07520 [Candidatus Diapherotrites archaeon]